MNKIIMMLCLLGAFISISAQEIKVIESEDTSNNTTRVMFNVPVGVQIPLLRPMGSMNLDGDNQQIIIRQFELIGSAPIELELENGFYEFQLYKDGVTKSFEIIANGGTQEWDLKPRGEFIDASAAAFWGGLVATSVGAIGYFAMSSQEDFYQRNPDFFDPPMVPSSVFLVVGGVGISSLITGIVSGVIQAPDAKLSATY